MALIQELAPGDTLVIGNTRIRLERKSGQRARLRIDSDQDVEHVKAGGEQPPATHLEPKRTGTQPFLRRPQRVCQ